MSVSIRLAGPADYPTFARLFVELRTPDPTPNAEFFETQMLPSVIIAEENGVPVGYCFWIEGNGHVAHVVVDPEARNRGVGRTMLDFVRGRMRAAGRAKWALNVKKDNVPAIALYRRCRFEVAGERWLVRTTFTELAKLPNAPAEAFVVEPADEARVVERFAIDPHRFHLWRSHGGKTLVGLRNGDGIVGFAAFDPKFPGFPMFHVATVELAGTLAGAVRPSATEDRVHIFVESAALSRVLPGEILNEILYMTGDV